MMESFLFTRSGHSNNNLKPSGMTSGKELELKINDGNRPKVEVQWQ